MVAEMARSTSSSSAVSTTVIMTVYPADRAATSTPRIVSA